ncbi:MAG: glucokinase [Sphingomonas bacterium]|uniref:glucokinase n=1 Tax=Sphingomonas bacterium TaxID=1895847 RepID=UPI00262B7737|nr:ROK family protein [Sphingomonas bacterium]MDB5705885.1 glucokinase [Sphingomonas bacterium]
MTGDDVGLVADIGRQSVRFALTGGPAGIAPRDVRSYHTAENATFTSALLAYLGEVGLRDAVLPSVLAVAGAARGDLINLTGSRWYISLSGVEAVLRARPRALNECAATALALTTLNQSAFTPVGTQSTRLVQPGGNYVVVSIGTGLGVAALITGSNGRLSPVASEAGHMTFSPNGADEEKFAAYIRTKGQASAESLLSASGLVAAYAALAEGGKTVGSPEEVTRSNGRDPVATAVVRMFASYLGAFIGDLVMTFGAWEGVYLTGPIPRALLAQLDARFRHRLEAKDAFRRQLGEVPIAIVNRSDLELMGAAAALHDS